MQFDSKLIDATDDSGPRLELSCGYKLHQLFGGGRRWGGTYGLRFDEPDLQMAMFGTNDTVWVDRGRLSRYVSGETREVSSVRGGFIFSAIENDINSAEKLVRTETTLKIIARGGFEVATLPVDFHSLSK